MKTDVLGAHAAPDDQEDDSLDPEQPKRYLQYGVEDNTNIFVSLIFGFQHVLLSISGTIAIPLIVAKEICTPDGHVFESEMIATFLVIVGINTWLQCTLGVRLPIVQGGSNVFIVVIIAVMQTDNWKCPGKAAETFIGNSSGNTDPVSDPPWIIRIREIQGALMLASLVQVFLGFSGLIGVLVQHIGPLTIAPTITLIGIALIPVGQGLASQQWGIAALTIVLILVFSLYLGEIEVPIIGCSRQKNRRIYVFQYPIFKLLPIILSVAISWLLCAVLTAGNVLPHDPKEIGYTARTDRTNFTKVDWIYLPYPGQYGLPTVSLTTFLSMTIATIQSVIESIGDYYSCARIAEVPPPPAHAVNRGIASEGIGSVIAGAFGCGGGTTSYSQNIGAIGFTKVGSRRAFQAAAFIFVVIGIFGKFSALLASMPQPILGGVMITSFAMIISVGLSNLRHVDMSILRNQCIFGLSLTIGLMVPSYFSTKGNEINTGTQQIDQLIAVVLSNQMLLGGLTGFILDSTVPGTAKSRGMQHWRDDLKEQEDSGKCKTYDIPFISGWLRRTSCCAYVPFLPSFRGFRKKGEEEDQELTVL